jgi:hypothetical protein
MVSSLVVGGYWLVVGGYWLVVIGWWLVVADDSEYYLKIKTGSAGFTDCRGMFVQDGNSYGQHL